MSDTDSKELYEYIKAYTDAKGGNSHTNYESYKEAHFKWAQDLKDCLFTVDTFKKMLSSYGAFLTKVGKLGWNMKTMRDRAKNWKERQDAFEAKSRE